MNFIALIFTAFALSMDAFAVSITKGMTIKNLKKSTALKMALTFGVFQGAMPLLGWALGISFGSYIKSIDHWIAFILLGFIGFYMLTERQSRYAFVCSWLIILIASGAFYKKAEMI